MMMLRALPVLGSVLLAAACDGSQGKQGPSRPPVTVECVLSSTRELPRKASVSGVLAAQEDLVLGPSSLCRQRNNGGLMLARG